MSRAKKLAFNPSRRNTLGEQASPKVPKISSTLSSSTVSAFAEYRANEVIKLFL
jgi:hypothetical protein